MSDKNNVYVTSVNQSGGITANKVVINNITQEISNSLEAKLIFANKQEGEYYVTKAELYSKHTIPNLFLAAYASTIENFDVGPMRAGMFMTGHSGKREGYHFTNIPNFGGKYMLRVSTTQPEEIVIEYNDE